MKIELTVDELNLILLALGSHKRNRNEWWMKRPTETAMLNNCMMRLFEAQLNELEDEGKAHNE
jgi:hypothetical protein